MLDTDLFHGTVRSVTQHWRRMVLIKALLLGAAAVAHAQAGPLDAVCPAGKAPVIDSASVVVGITPEVEFRGKPYSSEQLQRTMFYADAIRARFVPPASLGTLPVLGHAAPGQDSAKRVVPMLAGELVLITKPNGRLRTLAWQRRPLPAALGNALVKAARDADAVGDFDGLLRNDGVKGDDTLIVALTTDHVADIVPLALMRAMVPTYVVDAPALVVKLALPVYPADARRAGVTGDVVAAFILGSDAKVVDESVQLMRADWYAFMGPVRRSLRDSQFRAATSNGCRVPVSAMHAFAFRFSEP